MPSLTNKYLNRERELSAERQTELSYLFMQAVVRVLKQKAWTASRLAEEVGVNRSQVTRWLNGTANLRLDTIARIEKALGTPLIEVDREASIVFERRGLPQRPPAARLDVTSILRSVEATGLRKFEAKPYAKLEATDTIDQLLMAA